MWYRKKPIEVEAIKWSGDNFNEVREFCPEASFLNAPAVPYMEVFIIPTLEGNMQCSIGDYIIKGIKGEFYPCKPDIFEKTYDLF